MDYVADINELNNYKINDYKQINKKNLGKKLKSVRINNNHLEKIYRKF